MAHSCPGGEWRDAVHAQVGSKGVAQGVWADTVATGVFLLGAGKVSLRLFGLSRAAGNSDRSDSKGVYR